MVINRPDGRTARGERTRRAVVEAHIALIEEGELKPTGAQIADRAGISLRALWARFNDLETLFEATGAELLRRECSMFVPVSPDLALDERIDAFCEQRVRMLEFIAPFGRAVALREPFSPSMRANRLRHLARVTDEIEILFARELALLSEESRNRAVLALCAASTWGSWAILRDQYGMQPSEARHVMQQTVTALLMSVVRSVSARPSSPR